MSWKLFISRAARRVVAPAFLLAAIGAIVAMPPAASAQLLGGLTGQVLPGTPLGGPLRGLTDQLTDNVGKLERLTAREAGDLLERIRLDRIDTLLRDNRENIERDRHGDPALRGVLVASGIDDTALAAARAAGFTIVSREDIAELDLSVTRFAVPTGVSLAEAERRLAALLPAADIAADTLYFPSGGDARIASVPLALAASAVTAPSAGPRIGMIDGGVGTHTSLPAIEQRGFARNAPHASGHGTAVASLLVGRGKIAGAAPRARLLAADVYGDDPAGGNATAIVRALGWMVQRNVPVVTISLVGPANALLGKAVAAAQAKGTMVVAAVGNDGPAAPPAYPASYDNVVAVTGVDRRNRALVEAGRARHVDFAAPGADLKGARIGGGLTSLRGTSYAAPFVAARLLAHHAAQGESSTALAALVREAKDLGKPGRDPLYGYGLVCGKCATR
ncbi:S8 family serine peptidase [Sphingorhabdus soli]|uniref:S8 family serine peptidase n=1 Tax=Flavisphingopyxis soli TaxID=2601267 RepID=A0A5C6UNE0_9SPHN|nr:S8 family serine peptidase [Sphingorhabdus soli]TXC74084.1 S8 family serine peptidase [Sphingorhabdus soli]